MQEIQKDKKIDRRERVSYKINPENKKWISIEAAVEGKPEWKILDEILTREREKSNKIVNEEYN